MHRMYCNYVLDYLDGVYAVGFGRDRPDRLTDGPRGNGSGSFPKRVKHTDGITAYQY
jgi:hypothetical protein